VWGDHPAAPYFTKQLISKKWIISFAPLKQEWRVPYPGKVGLVETDESSQAIHRQVSRWWQKSSPIGTAEHQVKKTEMISHPEWDERILVVHPDPGDESPGYFQSPLWGSWAEQNKQSILYKVQEMNVVGVK
jgi:hypothetical protein